MALDFVFVGVGVVLLILIMVFVLNPPEAWIKKVFRGNQKSS